MMRNAVQLRIAWIAQCQPLSFQEDLALVIVVDAAQDLHQRGFACAVFAYQRVNLSRLHVE